MQWKEKRVTGEDLTALSDSTHGFWVAVVSIESWLIFIGCFRKEITYSLNAVKIFVADRI